MLHHRITCRAHRQQPDRLQEGRDDDEHVPATTFDHIASCNVCQRRKCRVHLCNRHLVDEQRRHRSPQRPQRKTMDISSRAKNSWAPGNDSNFLKN